MFQRGDNLNSKDFQYDKFNAAIDNAEQRFSFMARSCYAWSYI